MLTPSKDSYIDAELFGWLSIEFIGGYAVIDDGADKWLACEIEFGREAEYIYGAGLAGASEDPETEAYELLCKNVSIVWSRNNGGTLEDIKALELCDEDEQVMLATLGLD